MMKIGVISDTHGLLRPDALAALTGVDLILHAGDVGGAGLLRTLRKVAPVRAVCGNVDDPQDPDLEPQIDMAIDGVSVHVSHGHELGSPTPDRLLARYTARLVVYGHTHRALVHRAGDRSVLNPGAAGPRRFHLRPSVALVTLVAGQVEIEIRALE